MIRKGMFISDRYEIIEKVGSGGMSDVYKAKCHKLNRFVAIKVLKSEFSEDKSFVSKFKVEAQSAAGLAHPNIVNVYDVGDDNGIYYIVMELIEGITLKKYIEKKGNIPVKEAVSIAIQVAQGIEAAHNNHIIHRDIKPQNIIISREGKVKVTDFGIARAASTNTISGNAMGSVHYISPEQAKGGYIDEKSDIYSLGITIYEMVTGTVPFEGESTVSVALQHLNTEVPNPRLIISDIPVSVEMIIEKCTQKKPERRYLKVAALIADLKKSLVTPDEDFVKMIPVSNGGTTVVLNDNDVSLLKEKENDETKEEKDELLISDDDLFGENDDIDAVNPKMDKLITILGFSIGIIVIILVILIATSQFGNCNPSSTEEKTTTSVEDESSISSKQTYVPDLVGMTEEEAQSALNESALGFKVASRESSNTVEKGSVISQSKEAGSVVDKNTTIELVVSDGPKDVTVPDVTGLNKDDAKELLEGDDYGFVVQFKYEINEEIEIDNVVKTEPAVTDIAKFGDSIVVIVSQGADTSDVEVPSIKGMTEKEAKAALAELSLTLKVEDEVYSTKVNQGEIISQDIVAGKSVPRGTEIGVVISLGEEETTTVAPVVEDTKSTIVITKLTSSQLDMSSVEVLDASGNAVDVITGTLTATLTYTNLDGESVTSDIVLDSASYISSWEQQQFSIEKEASLTPKPELTIVLKYTTYVYDETTATYVQQEKTAEVYNAYAVIY